MHTGLFGTNERFVPLQGARTQDEVVTLAYDKQKIKNAIDRAQDHSLDGPGALTAMIVLLLTAGCAAGRDRLGRVAG